MSVSATEAAADSSDATEVFSGACKAFREGLSEEDQKDFIEYQDSSSMIRDIVKRCEEHPIHEARLTRCCQRIGGLAGKLAPFFDIISIFVHAGPEFAGFAWGALRLVFQLGVHFTTFLEKLSEMLDRMHLVLPLYEKYVEIIKKRVQERGRKAYSLLSKSLAYIYTDIIQFCQQACKLFSRRKDLRFRAILIKNLSWKPFDERFSSIINRFIEHSRIFELEMKLSNISIFELNTELTDASVKETVSLSKRFAKFEEHYSKHEETRVQAVEDERAKKFEATMRARVRELIEWTNPQSWEAALQEASLRHTPGTGEWLFHETSYQIWKSKIGVCSDQGRTLDTNKNVLLVQGKPGYGKTILCAKFVEHLQSSQLREGQQQDPDFDEPSSITFFFFDEFRERSTHPTDSFRAILTQFLHMHRFNEDIIDAASVVMDTKGKGQLVASTEEVLSLLRYILERERSSVLIFDGVDECSQHNEFFRCLQAIIPTPPAGQRTLANPVSDTGLKPTPLPIAAEPGKCSIVLFSRPNVKFPQFLTENCQTMNLSARENLNDIEKYLSPKFQSLAEQGMLGQCREAQKLVTLTSKHANGMFLWAMLLMEYLHSDLLSVEDRFDALNDLVFLEGLDKLYSMILHRIRQSQPERARRTIKRIFHWVAGSTRPLLLSELQCAFAISARGSVPEVDKNTLSRISGALLEVAPDEAVRFVHTSVKDYLEAGKEVISDFYLPRGESQRYIALSCLIYLVHHVVPGPLSGSPQVTADRGHQLQKYPLLQYSLENWPKHASSGLNNSPKEYREIRESSQEASYDELLLNISKFVRNTPTVTTWIEASYVFDILPELDSLCIAIAGLHLPPSAPMDVHNLRNHLASDIENFSKDLHALNESWQQVLRDAPNEIWEPSVAAFTQSVFWVKRTEARATTLLERSKEYCTSIPVQSQVSSKGLEVGLIKLVPPRVMVDPNFFQAPSSHFAGMNGLVGWKAIYIVWLLETKSITIYLSIDIPPDNIQPLLNYARIPYTEERLGIFCDNAGRFEVPVAFSNNLRKILVLGCVITLHGPSGSGKRRFNERDFTFTSRNLSPWSGQVGVYENSYCFFRAIFSPAAEFLFTLRPSLKNGGRNFIVSDMWDMEIYDIRIDQDLDATTPAFSLSLPMALLGLSREEALHLNQHFVFHPFLPLLAFADKHKTFAWLFNDPNCGLITIHDARLENLSFSGCGNFIHGQFSGSERNFVVVELAPLLPNSSRTASLSPSYGAFSRSLTQNTPSQVMRQLSSAPPKVQTCGAIVFGRDNYGMAHMSVLHQFQAEGAIILHTLCEDGTVTSETLSRLPKELALDGNAVIVPSSENEGVETVRLVLNKAPQPYYSFFDAKQSPLPLVLERTKASIPVAVGTLQSALMNESDVIGSRMIMRRKASDDGRNVKRARSENDVHPST